MIIFILAVFGLIFGSFVNALVWRLHERAALTEGKQKASAAQLKKLSMLTGRSMCSHCGHELAAKDLVPLFSWLWLRGRCRYCHHRIQDNPLVEVMTAILFVLAYLAWPDQFHGLGLLRFIFWLVFLVGFMALAVYDLRWYRLPSKLIYPLTALAAVQVAIVAITKHSFMSAVGSLASALLISGIFYILYQSSKGQWIGFGDVRLGVLLGSLVPGIAEGFLIIFLASIFGTLYSLPMLIKSGKNLKAHIPFGPFLLLATYIIVLYGHQLVKFFGLVR